MAAECGFSHRRFSLSGQQSGPRRIPRAILEGGRADSRFLRFILNESIVYLRQMAVYLRRISNHAIFGSI